MPTYRYEAIRLQRRKNGKCVCGKRVTKSRTFEQTINPFNKNASGRVKTYPEIWDELKKEAAEWEKKPVFHSRIIAGNYQLSQDGIAILSCGERISMKDYN
jgi:hypothetical protein